MELTFTFKEASALPEAPPALLQSSVLAWFRLRLCMQVLQSKSDLLILLSNCRGNQSHGKRVGGQGKDWNSSPMLAMLHDYTVPLTQAFVIALKRCTCVTQPTYARPWSERLGLISAGAGITFGKIKFVRLKVHLHLPVESVATDDSGSAPHPHSTSWNPLSYISDMLRYICDFYKVRSPVTGTSDFCISGCFVYIAKSLQYWVMTCKKVNLSFL